MERSFIILEIQGDFTWFANSTSTEPPVRYTREDAEREVESFQEARPTSRFIIVDIAPNLGFGGAF